MCPQAVRSRLVLRQRARANTTTSGVLLAAVAAPLGVAHGTYGALLETRLWLQGVCAAVSLALLASAWAILSRPNLGRVLATLGVLGILGLGTPYLLGAPLASLASLIAATGILAFLWRVGAPFIIGRVRIRPTFEGQAQGAAIMAFVLWFLWAFAETDRSLVDTLSVGWPLLVSTVLSVEWALRRQATHRYRAWLVLASIALALLLAPELRGDLWWMISALTGPAFAAALLIQPTHRIGMETTSWWEPLLGHPERLFVGTFAALCLGGTLLLALPPSATSGQSIGFVDAAFTATSAVCVTGLIVLDTPVDFSGLGQVFILLLIQVGGLGIMTFSTAALWALGKRMSLRHEAAVASLISSQDKSRLFDTAKRILLLTVLTEGGGALVLTIAFLMQGDALPSALWQGLFTSISAFCNAGFALKSASLVPYQHSALVLHVTSLLIILGGLSPAAVLALPAMLRRSVQPISAQARLAVSSSLVLLAVGFVLILAFEWGYSLADLDVLDKVHNAWFQSVTLRTAGFNSVDLTLVQPATLSLMLLLMFIGGCPGGTAGGVKTTTVSVLVLSVLSAMRGQWTVEAFGRRFTDRTLAKASVVVTVAALTGLFALLGVLLTQRMEPKLAIFEVVSALGTVGLSIGGTAQLDGIGKVIIGACMFVGRVGGLTLLMFLSSKRPQVVFGRPEEEIEVG